MTLGTIAASYISAFLPFLEASAAIATCFALIFAAFQYRQNSIRLARRQDNEKINKQIFIPIKRAYDRYHDDLDQFMTLMNRKSHQQNPFAYITDIEHFFTYDLAISQEYLIDCLATPSRNFDTFFKPSSRSETFFQGLYPPRNINEEIRNKLKDSYSANLTSIARLRRKMEQDIAEKKQQLKIRTDPLPRFDFRQINDYKAFMDRKVMTPLEEAYYHMTIRK